MSDYLTKLREETKIIRRRNNLLELLIYVYEHPNEINFILATDDIDTFVLKVNRTNDIITLESKRTIHEYDFMGESLGNYPSLTQIISGDFKISAFEDWMEDINKTLTKFGAEEYVFSKRPNLYVAHDSTVRNPSNN